MACTNDINKCFTNSEYFVATLDIGHRKANYSNKSTVEKCVLNVKLVCFIYYFLNNKQNLSNH
ncbi:MAG: hypothetical protein Edafosvirus5_31 [Edafosvirus sp.]|uniref:Uncharacterized protein n=1 Tax=Edafosvirus sp. TaxID=2487765 RepID=A0A3G4ZWZ2_9VIRU|nr:MAG: hypothetical protein Edafosvirus5_31 [Edafosvirus sp.]